jgi:hypothetical protein
VKIVKFGKPFKLTVKDGLSHPQKQKSGKEVSATGFSVDPAVT